MLEFKTPTTLAYLDNIKVSASFIFASSLLYDKKEFQEICEKIKNGKIKFSSVFPVGFLPKPLIYIPSELLEKLGNKKKEYKALSFLPEDAVKKLLENEENCEEEYIEKVKSFLENKEEQKIVKEDRIRNSLREKETKVFHLHLSKIFEACIYFSCEEEDVKVIKSAFKLLENLGLGQKISSGLGEFRMIKIEKEKTVEYPKKLLLSKCLITGEDFKGSVQVGEINLKLRKGKIFPKIPVFLEGCVFDIAPKGKYIETPDATYLTSCYGIYYGDEK